MRCKVGTRPSRLAQVQVEEALAFLGSRGVFLEAEIITIESDGDRDKATPFSKKEGGNFFTRTIEAALLRGEVDLAVHSAKDLEDDPPAGLVSFLTPCLSAEECLVTRGLGTLRMLPSGSIVGTSSCKRKEALARQRSDLVVKDIRGTIEERLTKLDHGEYDALIMARAALIRLGLEDRISEVLSTDLFPPHPLQGRLALQIRSDHEGLREIIRDACYEKK